MRNIDREKEIEREKIMNEETHLIFAEFLSSQVSGFPSLVSNSTYKIKNMY